MDRYDAFVALLATPDPPELPRRAHVWKCEGRQDRMEKELPPIMLRWLQRRILERYEPLPEPARKSRRSNVTKLRRVG